MIKSTFISIAPTVMAHESVVPTKQKQGGTFIAICNVQMVNYLKPTQTNWTALISSHRFLWLKQTFNMIFSFREQKKNV